MAYFALRCFSPEVGRYIIIGLNVIVAILGVTHWGCNFFSIEVAGLYGAIRSYYILTGLSDPSLLRLYDSPIAYFAISGIVQVAVSIFAILMLLGIIGNTNKIWWVRALIILLVFEFAFDFFIAVYTSMMSSYYTSAFKTYLDYSLDVIDSIRDENARSFARSTRDFVKFCTAEAVITWIISIPAVSIIILGLTDQLLNENTVEEMGKLIAVPAGPNKNTVPVHPINPNDTIPPGGSQNIIIGQYKQW